MPDPGWLSTGDPAASLWATLGGSVSPTPMAQSRISWSSGFGLAPWMSTGEST
jgi:hypothetical protein